MKEELIIPTSTTIIEALIVLKEHRYWSDSTYQSYMSDIKGFEEFLMGNGYDPTVENGERLSVVNRWILQQRENGVAYKTIARRVAALSSIYAFYKELGYISSNPFKASRVPVGRVNTFSRVLTMDDLKAVYTAILGLRKTEGLDIEIPIKLLIFTGLRNHALTALKVNDIQWEEELILYDYGLDNAKHKVQLLPLPPKFLIRLKGYIKEYNLQPESPLCFGLQGRPLKNKQLNRMVNRINEYLGWGKHERITPHGFRYSIATFLDEKGVSIDSIKYLLGHTERENVRFYLKRDQRKIFQIKKALRELEEELDQSLSEESITKPVGKVEESASETETRPFGNELPYTEEFLLQLADKNPDLLEKLLLKHVSK
ncbi:tyrosine-type recombinase/integrase [Fictibacillus enclensis]|uniref:tyrosine-type recombinase/integrase n=1 Tax=Fictibacillus enclensis TaxID=1017270 RepID=UPI0025A138DB|nr:tyrosine-type recombinase/integrase [Fictibacillus enclensis]MDM5338515.1 tyrosine-type recombinase/integrase [Fictibacillus enclensis]